ncbi:MAG TPA: GTPase domain-containing protein [Tepidisphaeraceae bacterium]|nr:GTPase domain-containing protein [Tepidisphaeraceae bacterium]
MNSELHNLVADVMGETGGDGPELLSPDSPGLAIAQDDPIYMVGLIGGKDVGKSSLINALIGLPVSRTSAAGPGTESVIAYAHRSAVDRLDQLLARIVPGKFEIIGHDNPELFRQVLVDLPDIDSVYAEHVEITRRMLRHLLYPVWLQSIEKYADLQPQQLLARVAEGNDPENFLFAINKIDLLVAREGESAAGELCDDYARRVAKTLSLAHPPHVFAVSAAKPERYDLPRLRAALSREKSQQDVSQARRLAARQHDRTLLRWLEDQQISDRAARARRVFIEADELVRQRLLAPVMETALPRLLDDPAYRAALVEPAIKRRLSRWPIVGAINTLAAPVMAFIKKSISSAGHMTPIDAVLQADSTPLSHRISTTFAHLMQTNPMVTATYAHNKLWEEPAALAAAAALRNRLRTTATAQSNAILKQAGGRTGLFAPIVRVLLTIGAIIWFPIAQPIAAAALHAGALDWAALGKQIVSVLSAGHLLQASSFLLIWFAVLWAALRWLAHARAERLIRDWTARDHDAVSQLSFAAQLIDWADDLLAPLEQSSRRLTELADRITAARAQSIDQRAA